MTKTELDQAYFDWMCAKVGSPKRGGTYQRLLHFLHEVTFDYTIEMDDNRAVDGIDFRYQFGYENNIPDAVIASLLDDRPCSILEMMVALAFRCEWHIIHDPDVGDRTGWMFWGMVDSLGLLGMDDTAFDLRTVNAVIYRFLNRRYEPNGAGGLFTLKDPPRDMRNVEIWKQMSFYLNEVYAKQGW